MDQAAGPSRILDIPEDKLSPDQAAALTALVAGRGRILAPYRIWLHSAPVALAMEKLGTFLNKAGSLSEREVEFTIVVIARHWQGEYVYQAHVKRCLELGVPQGVIDAIRANTAPQIENPRERAIWQIAKAAEQPGPGSDEMFDGAVAALGRNGLAEVIALLGYYSAVSIAMKLHRVPLPGSERK